MSDNFTLLFNDKPINTFYKIIDLLENPSQLILYFSIIINQNQIIDIGWNKIKYLLGLKTDEPIIKITNSIYYYIINKLNQKSYYI